MYLLPSGVPARPNTKWRGLGILPAMMDRSTIDRYSGAASNFIRYVPNGSGIIPRPPIVPVVEKPTPIVSAPPRPMPRPILDLPQTVKPTGAIVPAANAGTPVPSGYPVNQFYVATDGSVWEFTGGKWFNTGTPYSAPGATASASSPAPAPSAPDASAGSTSAPSAPVNVSVTSDSGYQTILDWLPQSTLLSFAPNWAVLGVGALAAWKLFGKGGR